MMRAEVTRPSRWWYLIGVAVIVLGLAAISLYLDLRLPDIRFVAPNTCQVELASARDYVVYYEYRSVVDGRAFQTSVDLPPISLSLTSPDTGNAVELRPPQGTFEYTVLRRSGRAILEFTLDKPGTYLFAARYNEGATGPDVVFAIGENRSLLDALVIGFATFLAVGVGAGVIIATAVWRYLAGKKMAATLTAGAGSVGTVSHATGPQGHGAHSGRRWDRLVWLIQFLPLLLWVVIAFARGSDGSAKADFTAVKYTLYAIAAVLLVLIFLLSRTFRKPDSAVSRWTGSWSWTARNVALIVVAGILRRAVGVYGFICFIAGGDFLSLLVLCVPVTAISRMGAGRRDRKRARVRATNTVKCPATDRRIEEGECCHRDAGVREWHRPERRRMSPALVFVLIIAAVVVVVIAGAVWTIRMRNKRRQEVAGWAQANSLKFLPANDHSLRRRYQAFKCLQRGENRYAYNICMGTIGQRVTCAFDYHYETHSTDSKGHRQTHHHRFSGLVVDAGIPLKPLYIRPEGLFDKLTEFMGFDDIDFESAEFSRKFYVKAPDRRWAFDVLHQKTMEVMLLHPRFHIEFQGNQVMAYHAGKTFSLGEFTSALKVVTEMLDLLPPGVVEELRANCSGGGRA